MTTFIADLIDEDTLEVLRQGEGATREEALAACGYKGQPGYDANVREIKPALTGLSGCGVHSFYVD